jgi:hypothetical protein
LVADPCAPAPSDTLTFEGLVLEPEGEPIQASNLFWELAGKPAGSFRELITSPDAFQPTFKPDLTGDYTVCLEASDPEGERSDAVPAEACTCAEANADTSYACPCVTFSALPREDIRIELTWDFLGPDLDLHLVAPGGDFCSPTQECRYNKNNPQDPTWDRTACVDTGSMTVCRTPNCDPVAAGCQAAQECYDDDDVGPNPPGCWWNTCSGTDCFWDARNPDWGALGDTTDDPLSAIDCTRGCRVENINLNRPIPGIYTVMVNQFDGTQQPNATVRIYFKGDVVPSREWTSRMLGACDTWNVALIEWVDHENHPVIYLDDAHSLRCCT